MRIARGATDSRTVPAARSRSSVIVIAVGVVGAPAEYRASRRWWPRDPGGPTVVVTIVADGLDDAPPQAIGESAADAAARAIACHENE